MRVPKKPFKPRCPEGKPCPECPSGGHSCRRLKPGHTADHKCICGFRWQSEASRSADQQWKKSHPESIRTAKKKCRTLHPEVPAAYAIKRRLEFPEKVKAENRASRMKHKEKIYAKTDVWRKANPGKVRESRRLYYWKYPAKARRMCLETQLKRRYGITLERYDELLAAQGGICYLCEEPPKRRRLAVDHDHRCCPGKITCGRCIRGLLCFGCNSLMGHWDKIKKENLSSKLDVYSRRRVFAPIYIAGQQDSFIERPLLVLA